MTPDPPVLVVNGDDFGLTPGVNRGILHAHHHGILTSASVFANAPATAEAFALAAQTPSLGVGVHLTLVDGVPMLAATQIPTLAPDGHFRPTWVAFIAAILARRVSAAEIERELAAQIEHVRGAGIQPTHLDAHKHVHAHPAVFAIVTRLASRFGIRVVRIPCEQRPFGLLASTLATPRARRQAFENAALAPWAAEDRRILARAGLPAAPAFAGRVLTGLFTRDGLKRVIARCAAGVTELMTHPGYADAALDGVRTRLRTERQTEVALLTDPDIIEAVARADLTLRSHDAAAAAAERHSHVP
jgi:hopanoid biosynthesis associated protein HpnK